MIVDPEAGSSVASDEGGLAGGAGGACPSARHPSTTVINVPRTFTSPATTGGAPGMRVVGRRGRISRTKSTSAAQASVPTRNTSKRAGARLPSVIGCEEAKILQAVNLSKQIRVACRVGERGPQIRGPLRLQRERRARHVMHEGELGRMQPLAPLGLHARRRRHTPAAPERVLAIADDRAPDVREMDADLMRAARAEPDAQQVGVREAGDDA